MVGGYLLLVYPPSLVEYTAGAIIASGSAAAVALVTDRRWRRLPEMLRTLAGLPWQLLRGYLRMLAAGLAPRGGAVRGQLRRERATGIGQPGPAPRCLTLLTVVTILVTSGATATALGHAVTRELGPQHPSRDENEAES